MFLLLRASVHQQQRAHTHPLHQRAGGNVAPTQVDRATGLQHRAFKTTPRTIKLNCQSPDGSWYNFEAGLKSEGAGHKVRKAGGGCRRARARQGRVGAHLFLTRRSPSPGSGTGESRCRVTASLKFWLSLVTTSFFMELGMDEPWKSRK